MTYPNRNALWAAAVAQELARSGVRDVCVSPGSRSTPLVLAIHAEKALRITTHLDERSGAYFAVGSAKASGRPVALLCTSGTAAANYLPAVIEAHESGASLIVLTADRPPELHEVGANQSVDQQHLYGNHVRLFADPGVPQIADERLRHLRGLVCRAVASSKSPYPGPVHLNFPFQEPLEPTPVPGDVPERFATEHPLAFGGRADGQPYLDIATAFPRPDEARLDEVAQLLDANPDGLIVAGPGTNAPSVLRLGERLGYPVLADPLSGLRFGEGSVRCATYDAFLAVPGTVEAIRPKVVLRFGATPTSKALLNAMAAWTDAAQVLVDESARHAEPTHASNLVLPGRNEALAHELETRVRPRSAGPLGRLVAALDQATVGLFAREVPARAFEGRLLSRLAATLPAETVLWIGSSLPVRDLDRYGATRADALRVLANRGASGIDGVVSSALGAAHVEKRRVVLVLGDVSFLHDLSALVTATRLGIRLDVLVLNNDGGGLFEFLPIAKHEPPFTELFVTPHGQDPAAFATAARWDARTCDEAEALEALATRADRPRLFHVPTDRGANVRHRAEIQERLAAELRQHVEVVRRAH